MAVSNEICVTIDPGICGFACVIRASKIKKRRVSVHIAESDCQQIRRLSAKLQELTLSELLMPMTRNPVYRWAENSGCHASCVIPAAVLKAVEAAMEMASPKNVVIHFQTCD
jgi:hypothetical protein